MGLSLYDHQLDAIENLKTGSILCGGVGSGKSRTALAYYYLKECEGKLEINKKGKYVKMKKPKDLYIITTARKRDTLEWEKEMPPFLLSSDSSINTSNVNVIVDSWNNVKKYINVKDSFFIFDEQRVVGAGTWVKSFLKITKDNTWILLTATPGDTWSDYIPVFIANGYYKNRTEFCRRHVVYSYYARYPQIDHYVEECRLRKLRDAVIVHMPFERNTITHHETIITEFDKNNYNMVMDKRWNIYEDKPTKDISEVCFILRRIVNSDSSRLKAIRDISKQHKKIIIFYNYNYELELLREVCTLLKIKKAEWNGHKHESIPTSDKWIYLVQYTAGAEGWNCIETNVVVFYSQNYSYKIMEQAAGRIDRLNTPFIDLYYYHLRSKSKIDLAILQALNKKRTFNEFRFMDK